MYKIYKLIEIFKLLFNNLLFEFVLDQGLLDQESMVVTTNLPMVCLFFLNNEIINIINFKT